MRTSGWSGADASAPPIPPTWLCVQISPGRLVFPDASIRTAVAGTSIAPESPTARITPPWTTRVPRAISSPSIGMIRAPTNAREAEAPVPTRYPRTR